MDTTTAETVLAARDWFDFLVGSVTILTGIAIAVLAGSALAVQVTRYLSDSESVVRIGHSYPTVRVPEPGDRRCVLDGVELINRSLQTAVELRWESVRLSGPTVLGDLVNFEQRPWEIADLNASSIPPLLPETSQHVRL